MRIYKLIVHVTEYNRRKDRRETILHKESVYIRKLAGAKAEYAYELQCLKSSFSYSTKGIEKTGSISLFIPHVFDNGLLAYWPDNNKYIERQDFTA